MYHYIHSLCVCCICTDVHAFRAQLLLSHEFIPVYYSQRAAIIGQWEKYNYHSTLAYIRHFTSHIYMYVCSENDADRAFSCMYTHADKCSQWLESTRSKELLKNTHNVYKLPHTHIFTISTRPLQQPQLDMNHDQLQVHTTHIHVLHTAVDEKLTQTTSTSVVRTSNE